QGRRIPSFSSETTLPTCLSLFSGALTDIVQQIHSLRESGVISSQAASALASEDRAFRKSAGNLCTVPSEIVLDIGFSIANPVFSIELRIFGYAHVERVVRATEDVAVHKAMPNVDRQCKKKNCAPRLAQTARSLGTKFRFAKF